MLKQSTILPGETRTNRSLPEPAANSYLESKARKQAMLAQQVVYHWPVVVCETQCYDSEQAQRISSGTGRTGANHSVCEAQVALIHLGGHEIGYIILIQSCCRVGTVHCGDFRPRTWQGDGSFIASLNASTVMS